MAPARRSVTRTLAPAVAQLDAHRRDVVDHRQRRSPVASSRRSNCRVDGSTRVRPDFPRRDRRARRVGAERGGRRATCSRRSPRRRSAATSRQPLASNTIAVDAGRERARRPAPTGSRRVGDRRRRRRRSARGERRLPAPARDVPDGDAAVGGPRPAESDARAGPRAARDPGPRRRARARRRASASRCARAGAGPQASGCAARSTDPRRPAT